MADREPRRVPFVVGGRRWESTDGETDVEITTVGDAVQVPGFGPSLAEELVRLDRDILLDVPEQEIVGFLHRVGVLWQDDEYARRRLFVRQLCDVVGFSEAMAVAEADLIGSILTGSHRLWDTIAVELGDRHILDAWVRREDALVRAFPRGLAVHVLAGTVPVASVVSIVRSLVTKNITLAKFASGDPVTATSLALSFLDCDAAHPVAQALQVVHWGHGDAIVDTLLAHADLLCVWGGRAAMDWAREHSGDAELLRFGPRRSLALVEVPDASDEVERVARRVAHDVSMYDQNACFSTLQVFVAGQIERFARSLAVACERAHEVLPSGVRPDDLQANVHAVRLHHEFLGHPLATDSDGAWTTIQCGPDEIDGMPAGRTIFLHEVRELDDALPWIDATVQTVAVHPWGRIERLADDLARRGVARIVEVGLSTLSRLGASHDGVYPLTRFVRLASIEDPADRYGKGMVVPLELGEMVERREYRNLVL